MIPIWHDDPLGTQPWHYIVVRAHWLGQWFAATGPASSCHSGSSLSRRMISKVQILLPFLAGDNCTGPPKDWLSSTKNCTSSSRCITWVLDQWEPHASAILEAGASWRILIRYLPQSMPIPVNSPSCKPSSYRYALLRWWPTHDSSFNGLHYWQMHPIPRMPYTSLLLNELWSMMDRRQILAYLNQTHEYRNPLIPPSVLSL